MSFYGICECCAVRGGPTRRESRRERLWLTTDYRRLCQYHYELYLDGDLVPPRIADRAQRDPAGQPSCTIEELRVKLDLHHD